MESCVESCVESCAESSVENRAHSHSRSQSQSVAASRSQSHSAAVGVAIVFAIVFAAPVALLILCNRAFCSDARSTEIPRRSGGAPPGEIAEKNASGYSPKEVAERKTRRQGRAPRVPCTKLASQVAGKGKRGMCLDERAGKVPDKVSAPEKFRRS